MIFDKVKIINILHSFSEKRPKYTLTHIINSASVHLFQGADFMVTLNVLIDIGSISKLKDLIPFDSVFME